MAAASPGIWEPPPARMMLWRTRSWYSGSTRARRSAIVSVIGATTLSHARRISVVMSIWVAQASAPPKAQAVLTNVEKFYAGTKQVSATFAQQVTRPGFGTKENSTGKVYLAKPGKMRWVYTDK